MLYYLVGVLILINYVLRPRDAPPDHIRRTT